MKIVSKYKDYYDYLSGIYGSDEKLILERNDKIIDYTLFNDSKLGIHIGEYLIEGFVKDNNIFYTKDIENISLKKVNKYDFLRENVSQETHYAILIKEYHKGYKKCVFCLKNIEFLGEKSPTWKLNCPILLERFFLHGSEYIEFPKLEKLQVQRVIKPEDIWLYLSSWLGKRIDKLENNNQVQQTNKEKILSKGFDLKKSFRNIK